MKAIKVETYLPIFKGFYGSHWDGEQAVESELQHFKDEYNLELTYDNLEIDWEEYFLELSKEITYKIEETLIDLELIKSLTFQKLQSPKFYNYSNDTIYVEIELDKEHINSIKRAFELNKDENVERIYNDNRSRSGFIPYYSPSDFLDENDNLKDSIFSHEHHLGYILDVILQYEINEYELEIESEWLLPITNYDELIKNEATQ